jgi:hypothetical protein
VKVTITRQQASFAVDYEVTGAPSLEIQHSRRGTVTIRPRWITVHTVAGRFEELRVSGPDAEGAIHGWTWYGLKHMPSMLVPFATGQAAHPASSATVV